MKTGAGDDPFADETDGDADVDVATDERPESAEQVESSPTTNGQTSADPQTPAATDTQSTEDDQTPEIPWVLRRSSVKDDRPNVTQFFLQDETDRGERRFRNEVEELLDRDVYTLDLREAAYLVAMEHPEEVADLLTEWGYEYLD